MSTFSICNSSGSQILSISASNVFTSTTTTNTFTATVSKTTYNVLGEDVEVEGIRDGLVAMNIALINIHGRKYYEELKKQNIYFHGDLDDAIQRRLTIIDRDQKIDSVVNDKGSM